MGILRLVIEGKSSKEIANILHRSVRTVEVHRSRIMQKLGVNNLIDLVKRAVVMGIVDFIDEQDTFSQRFERHAGVVTGNFGVCAYGPVQYLEVLKRSILMKPNVWLNRAQIHLLLYTDPMSLEIP